MKITNADLWNENGPRYELWGRDSNGAYPPGPGGDRGLKNDSCYSYPFHGDGFKGSKKDTPPGLKYDVPAAPCIELGPIIPSK